MQWKQIPQILGQKGPQFPLCSTLTSTKYHGSILIHDPGTHPHAHTAASNLDTSSQGW